MFRYIDHVISRVFDKTATKKETATFINHVCDELDKGYDAWQEEYDKLTDEQESERFIQLQQDLGCKGTTHEEALAFFDQEFPGNARRANLEKRRLSKIAS